MQHKIQESITNGRSRPSLIQNYDKKNGKSTNLDKIKTLQRFVAAMQWIFKFIIKAASSTVLSCRLLKA